MKKAERGSVGVFVDTAGGPPVSTATPTMTQEPLPTPSPTTEETEVEESENEVVPQAFLKSNSKEPENRSRDNRITKIETSGADLEKQTLQLATVSSGEPILNRVYALRTDASSRTPNITAVDTRDRSTDRNEDPELATLTLFAQMDSMAEEVASDGYLMRLIAGTSVVATGTVSAGFVLWSARAGYLVTLLSSSLPAWASIDPIPVLDAAALQTRQRRETSPSTAETLADIANGPAA